MKLFQTPSLHMTIQLRYYRQLALRKKMGNFEKGDEDPGHYLPAFAIVAAERKAGKKRNETSQRRGSREANDPYM